MDVSVIDAAQTVLATLNYSQRTAEKPYAYTYEPPQGVPARSGRLDAAENVPIRDARPFADQLSLEEQGFLLRHHKSAVSDFYDEEQLCTLYYAEIDRLLKVATGAEKVVIFDHTIRSVPRAKLGQAGMREPVRRVHNDYTETSGRRRVRDHLESDEADVRLGQRFMEINVWRPIRGPLQDAPLAVCDARSIAPEDRIAADLIYRDRKTETYSFNYSPAHRWYYYPEMRRDEAILFKGFDSDKSAKARFTAHTAFDDPTAPRVVLPRESIEVRALVFLPEG
jgi:hypothetical protein